MDDLARWLSEQLDEDAARATAACKETGPGWYYDDGFVFSRRDMTTQELVEQCEFIAAFPLQDFLEQGRGEHVAEWDPARVLREIDAKRRTLIRCEEAMLAANPMLVHFAKQTLREMALGFSGRPGYEEAVAAFE